MSVFNVIKPTASKVPFILSIPHSGTKIPNDKIDFFNKNQINNSESGDITYTAHQNGNKLWYVIDAVSSCDDPRLAAEFCHAAIQNFCHDRTMKNRFDIGGLLSHLIRYRFSRRWTKVQRQHRCAFRLFHNRNNFLHTKRVTKRARNLLKFRNVKFGKGQNKHEKGH